MVSFRRTGRDDATTETSPDANAAHDDHTRPLAGGPVGDRPADRPVDRPVDRPADRPVATRPVEPEHTQRIEQAGPVAPAPGGSALDDPAYERFGGANVGAAFFGWMVAVGMTVLLSGIIGAVLLVVGQTAPVADLRADVDLSTASIVSAAVVLVVLLLAYYSGGYVAGRMSRFDGGRQGFAVWLLALLFTVLAGVAGFLAGDRFDVLSGADLPTVALTGQETTVAGLVSLAVVLFGTLLAAIAGGKVGRRYHAKVDRAL